MVVQRKNAAFSEQITETIDFCMQVKQQMLKLAEKRGGELRPAKKDCPFKLEDGTDCKGSWRFVLIGRRKHMHAACNGRCNRRMME